MHQGIPVAQYVAAAEPSLDDQVCGPSLLRLHQWRSILLHDQRQVIYNVSLQVVQPNPDNAAAYAAAFERHQALGELLFGSKTSH